MGRGVVDGGGGVFELASSWNLYDDFVKRCACNRQALHLPHSRSPSLAADVAESG